MSARVERLKKVLAERGLDAMLVVQPENRRYISGFTGSAGAVVVTCNQQLFFTDFRYIEQAREQCVGFEIVNQGTSFLEALEHTLRTLNLKSVGFEQEFLTYGEVERYRALESRLDSFQWVPTSGVVEGLRVYKDEVEVECIQKAADIADAAFNHIIGFLRPGISEQDVALELEVFMRKQGASGPAFQTIVASGWRSALPHGVASDKMLELGDFVKMDYGAVYQGYRSDITRTVVLGTPTDKHKEIYQIVLDAQLKSLDAVKAGIHGRDLDAVARDYISSRGYGDAFGHSLGHGLGLAIHEDPRASAVSKDVLLPGMVVTIEPGIYLPGWGGVRIEDDVLLLEEGIRIFTHAPKLELISIG